MPLIYCDCMLYSLREIQRSLGLYAPLLDCVAILVWT